MPEDQPTVRDRYLEQMVESASPEGLLILLVEGAVNFIRRAETALREEKFDEAHNCFVKAQNIYLELTITLDLDAAEFTENLGLVYQFIYNLLIEANVDKDLKKTSEALKLAEQIRDLWKDTVKAAKSGEATEPGSVSKLAAQVPEMVEAPKTGVYAPAGRTIVSEDKIASGDGSSTLNITG